MCQIFTGGCKSGVLQPIRIIRAFIYIYIYIYIYNMHVFGGDVRMVIGAYRNPNGNYSKKERLLFYLNISLIDLQLGSSSFFFR
jgi:hypothetical protein